MKIVYEYSHLGGTEILHMRFPKQEQEIYDVISSVKGNRSKISREKTKRGRELYSPIDMNNQFGSLFRNSGYVELRDTYTIAIPNYPVEVGGAYNFSFR